ncbi:unnamed protein product [Bemisia tabaci]|uniref:Uncharacterized protein n=1 Tax=Bemisia tabaci TaxID=7038 RepID=A0A9P0C9V1_BEMTA|nr:unnamed protein product [Bemisia tabaci]
MCKSLIRLLVSCQILFLVIPDVSPSNPNTPEFVANRRKMLDLVLNDKCKKLNHLSREFKKVHVLHGFAKPRKYLRSLPQKREWFAAKSVANQACNETLLLFTKLPDEERTACDGAFQPMCRLIYKEKGWVCSVLWSDELEPFPPKKHDFKYCAEKSLAVDEAYREKSEPEVGAGSSPGHQRRYSPSRGSKNSDTSSRHSDTSSRNSDTSSRNSKRNRKNAEATNEIAINGQESSRGSDDESEPLTKSSSLITQYSEDSRNSQKSKSSSDRDIQRSTSSNGRDILRSTSSNGWDGQRSTSNNGRNSQRSTSSNNKSVQRSKGGKKEYIEAVKRAAIAANTVLLKPSIEKGGGAHGMKSKAEMAIDWVASHGKKLWDKGREDVLKTGKAWIENGGGAHGMKNKAEIAKDWVASHGKKLWDKGREDVLKTGKALIENGGGAHRMKSKAGKVTDWVANLGRKFWDRSRKDVLKTGNRQEGSRSSDGEDTASTKYYSLTTQHSDDSSSSQRSQSSSSTNSQRSKRSNGRESQKSRSRKRENFKAERQAVVVAAAAAVAANGALDDARVKKDEKADKIRNKQQMVQDWMDSDGEKSWGTGGESDLKTGNSHQHDVKSPVRDSPKVRSTGRANSPSSPNHAFYGISLTVKLNKHHPGDVSIDP